MSSIDKILTQHWVKHPTFKRNRTSSCKESLHRSSQHRISTHSKHQPHHHHHHQGGDTPKPPKQSKSKLKSLEHSHKNHNVIADNLQKRETTY